MAFQLKALARRSADTLFPETMHQRRIARMAQGEAEISLIPNLGLRPGLALDVGANMGLYTHHLLKAGMSVVAFEPLPQMLKVLRRYYGDKARIEPIALSDRAGETMIRYPVGNFSWATIEASNHLQLAQETEFGTAKVEVRTLDSYAFENVRFLKIDVEGHEEAVLRGAAETLKRWRPVCVIEVEDRHNKGAVGRIFDLMKSYDYEGYFLWNGERHPVSGFRLERDQLLSNVGVMGKSGRYINNFVFGRA